MWTKEVIVSNPECKVIVRTINVIKTVCRTVGSFISSVKPFNHLFVWAIFGGYFIVISKSNYLCDIEFKIFTKFTEELLSGQRIGTITISNEFEMPGEFFFEVLKSHTHRRNAWTNTTVIRYPVTDNRAFGSIHDKPNISFYTTDFNIGFIGS